jgi:hypothetical protein
MPTVGLRAYVRVQGLNSDVVRTVWPWAYRWWGCVTVGALPTVVLSGRFQPSRAFSANSNYGDHSVLFVQSDDVGYDGVRV